MNETRFESYLAAFNTRDYTNLHRNYFAPDVKLYTLGHVLDGQEAIRNFYDFFHAYIEETISLREFYPVPEGIWAVLGMRLAATGDLTRELLTEHGVGNLTPIPKGTVYETTLFVHYQLEGDKFKKIRVAEFPMPEE